MASRFRIQAVAERTGVPAATLRAWERRYGVPRPVRTDAAYRVYSDGDIADILRMRELCDAGMSVGEAAQTLRGQEGPRALAPVDAPLPATPAEAYNKLVDGFIAAVRVMDLELMAARLAPIASLGAAAEVYEKVLMPALVRVGDLWHAGEISIGHEHLATEMVAGVARQLLQLAQPSALSRVVVLGCFADELHAVPLYGIGFRLLRWGCRSAILGARTPPTGVGPAVRELKPVLVGLSATIVPTASRARELVEGYAMACGDTPWLVGGAAAPELAPLVREFGGHVAPDDEAGLQELLQKFLLQ